jgi:hypothetical protein
MVTLVEFMVYTTPRCGMMSVPPQMVSKMVDFDPKIKNISFFLQILGVKNPESGGV